MSVKMKRERKEKREVFLMKPSDGVIMSNHDTVDSNGDFHVGGNNIVYDTNGARYELVTNLKVLNHFKENYPEIFKRLREHEAVIAVDNR